MNKFYLLSLTLLSLLFISCEKDDELLEENNQFDYSSLEDGISDDIKYYTNPPYPVNAQNVRILAIGNSFTGDAMNYIDELVTAACIDKTRLCLYIASTGGASFDTWIDTYRKETSINIWKITGDITMNANGTLPQLLCQPWDVIVVQQASNLSYIWNSYRSLWEYIQLITSACPNKNVCLVFQLPWSHTPEEMPYVLQGNIACCKKMSQRYGIDVIIPTGTAIQKARDTDLNDENYMTRDNWHLNTGIACYIASCTWFETLLRPVFGVSVVGNTARPTPEYTDADIILGQTCAEWAVQNPYYYYN